MLRSVLAVLLPLLVGCAAPATAIRGVTVIPMDSDRALAGQTVVIRGGVIAEIGDAARVRLPVGTRVIDGAGKFLMPGLADMHVHPNTSSELLADVAHGVTTILVLDGEPRHLRWRTQTGDGALVGPQLFVAGTILDGPEAQDPNRVVVSDAAQVREAIAAQAQAGYQAVKIYGKLRAEEFDEVVRVATGVHLPVFGHLSPHNDVARALRGGQVMVAHAEEFYYRSFDSKPDASRVAAVVAMVRDAGTTVTPNLSAIDYIVRVAADVDVVLAEDPLRLAAPELRQRWSPAYSRYATRSGLAKFRARNEVMLAFLRALTLAFHAAGVPLLAGSDASVTGWPGDGLHRELEQLVVAGLTPYAALVTATRAPGEFVARTIDADARFGVVAAGARADLVLLTADPRQDIANARRIAGVFTGGRWHTIDELQAMREAEARRFVGQLRWTAMFDAAVVARRWADVAQVLAQIADADVQPSPISEDAIVESTWTLVDSDPKAAAQVLTAATRLAPEAHALWNMLARARKAAGDRAGAHQAFLMGSTLAPGNAVSLLGARDTAEPSGR